MGHRFRNRSYLLDRSDKLVDGTRLGMMANTKKCWRVDLRVLPSRELLFWCLNQQSVDRMLVVVRIEQQGKRYFTRLELKQLPRTLFGSNVLENFRASEWPGTKLIGTAAHVFLVKFDESIAEVILRTEPDFTRWRHPSNHPLPEDICLFNSSPIVQRWLASHTKNYAG